MPEARTFVRPDGRRFLAGLPEVHLPPDELFAWVDENDVEKLSALEDLGFIRERKEFEVVIPTDAPRIAAPRGIGAVRADGVDEEALRLLDDELRRDVPGTDGWRWTAEDFHEETYLSPHFDPALYLVARAGADPVGICRVWLRPEQPRLGFVGVRRSLRRRGIARWLVGEVFAVLREYGIHEVGTGVDETNVASRTLLDGLGGRVVGASLELRRPSALPPSRSRPRIRT